MRSGVVYFVTETYDSDKFKVGSTIDTCIKTLYDNMQSMKLPAILTFYSIDIERDETTVKTVLKEKNIKTADEAITIFSQYFKNKLTNEPPQAIDDETKRMIDAMLAEESDAEN